ncbi:hypothetical protein AAFF_G00251820 [Aldrovandia affinis]|uniref:Uncharacterized protein n=1 Tax=Aldrovandia affinis TaxID=143900 RepID=A0AAD7SUR5_9TELE|nr:hypothetical protein AAFF_G00251820 [Aldrovandia affinis]
MVKAFLDAFPASKNTTVAAGKKRTDRALILSRAPTVDVPVLRPSATPRMTQATGSGKRTPPTAPVTTSTGAAGIASENMKRGRKPKEKQKQTQLVQLNSKQGDLQCGGPDGTGERSSPTAVEEEDGLIITETLEAFIDRCN